MIKKKKKILVGYDFYIDNFKVNNKRKEKKKENSIDKRKIKDVKIQDSGWKKFYWTKRWK